MKTGRGFLGTGLVVLTTLFNFTGYAQTSAYQVVERGADYKVLQKVTVENGTNRIHRYTELATGMHYTNALGQLVESREQIAILPTGGAAATQGRHQVYFPADIFNGMLEVITPDGRHLRESAPGGELR